MNRTTEEERLQMLVELKDVEPIDLGKEEKIILDAFMEKLNMTAITKEEGQQIEAALVENITLKEDMAIIVGCTLDLLGVFGLLNVEKTAIREEFANGTVDPTKTIARTLTGLVSDAMMAGVMPSKDAEMKEKFAFFKKIVPVIQRYGPATK